MYWIFVESEFEAAHGLTLADGTCEAVHLHCWHITAAVHSPSLNTEGLVMDFLELKKLLCGVIEPFAGRRLEPLPCFAGRNASAEAVAYVIFESLSQHIPPPARLAYIEVTEAAGCRARFGADV